MYLTSLHLWMAGEFFVVMLAALVVLAVLLIRARHRFQDEMADAEDRIDELLEYERRHEIVADNLQKAQAQARDLAEQLRQSEAMAVEQQAALEKFQNEIASLQQYRVGYGNLKKELERSRGEIEGLRTELESEQARRKEKHGELNELKTELDLLRAGNEQLQSEMEAAQAAVAAASVPAASGAEPAAHNTVVFSHSDEEQCSTELSRLRDISKGQRQAIMDLQIELARAREARAVAGGEALADDGVQGEIVMRLEQMLSESESAFAMLEGELAAFKTYVAGLEAQLAAVGDVNADAGQDEMANTDSGAEPESGESDQLRAQIDSLNQMVMTVMAASGDQGNVINFARKSIECHTLVALATAVLEAVAAFGLSGVLQMRGKSGDLNVSSDDIIAPGDLERVSDTSCQDRYQDDGARLVIFFDRVSLLLKDMPVDDPDKVGRIKDSLAITLELAVAEIEGIEAEEAVLQQQAVLKKVIANTSNMIKNVEQQFQRQANESKTLMDSLAYVMENKAFTDGMDPIYRGVFENILKESKEKFDKLHAEGVAVDAKFSEIINRLSEKV